MKIKNRITDKWSLECKDDYQSIREKVSFNEHSVPKNKMVFKTVMLSMTSLIVVFLLVLPLLSNPLGFGNIGEDIKGNKPDQPNACPPIGDADSKEDNNSESDESVEPDDPGDSKPGDVTGVEPSQGNYGLFIEDLDQGYINDSYIEYIEYLDPNNKTLLINDFSKVIEYLNLLEYSVYENDTVLNADHMIVINDGWATIIFDRSCYLAIRYKNKYVTYTTNEDNILENILEYLK